MLIANDQNKVRIAPTNEYEESICKNLMRNKTTAIVKKAQIIDDGKMVFCLRFKETNILILDQKEYKIEKVDNTIRFFPLTKEAEELCFTLLSHGGFATIDAIDDEKGYRLRFISTNPQTMIPWFIDATIPRKDITLGDMNNE